MPRETAKLRYLIWQREVDLYWQERFRNHVHTWDWLNQEDFDGCWTHHLTALHLAYAVAVFEWQTWALREQFVKRDHWSFAVQLPAAGDLRKQLCLVQPCFNHWRPVNLSLSVCRLHHPKLKCETLPPTRRYLHH